MGTATAGGWADEWPDEIDTSNIGFIETFRYIESAVAEIGEDERKHKNQVKAETLAKLGRTAKIQARQATKNLPGNMNQTRLRSMERHNMQSRRHQNSYRGR